MNKKKLIGFLKKNQMYNVKIFLNYQILNKNNIKKN